MRVGHGFTWECLSFICCSKNIFTTPMGKNVNALAFLLLLCFAIMTTVSAQIFGVRDFQGYLASQNKKHHKHRHSGFSEAECPGACTYRCSQTQYRKPCMFFCQKCCFKCRCVPPGTYGHKEVCPCYNNWKTKRGGPKCP